jgi:type II secretory pathway pseudopilin PulG
MISPIAPPRRAFTIVEMLVVISIIMILAGMILPTLSSARYEARLTECMSNMHQIGIALDIYAKNYGGGSPNAYPVWLTSLVVTGGKIPYLADPRVLFCPEDPTEGSDGGRPSGLKVYDGATGSLEVIHQFEMADIDPHDGPINGTGPKNESDGGINCSYLFEYCGEPCDWIYSGGPPVTSADLPGVPYEHEWQWEGGHSGAPTAEFFRQLVDRNRDGVLSWNEVKVFSRKGCDTRDPDTGSTHRLKGWDIRVPILRCYWHVQGGIMENESPVLNLRGDGSAVDRGVPMWFKD